jgi:hypothetical protein
MRRGFFHAWERLSSSAGLTLAWCWRVAFAVRVKERSADVFFLLFTSEPMFGGGNAHWKLL